MSIIIGILKFIWGWLTCGWAFNWVYNIEPINIWKSAEEMPFVLMGITNFIFAFLLVLVYSLIYKGLPGKGVAKGLWFGLFVWLVGALPGNFALGMVTTMATQVIIYWIVSFLIASLWQGLIIAVMYGKIEGIEAKS